MNAGHDSDKILDHTRQQLSALIDGELAPDEAAFLMRRLQHDDELAGCWERWQLAGAVLRGQAGLRVPDGFSARVMAAVAAEAVPTVPATRRRWLHWSGGAIAASVALVALFLARPAGPPQQRGESMPAPVIAQAGKAATPAAPTRQTHAAPATPAPSIPVSTAQIAAAVAVADVPRRVANARRSGGQAQRAASRMRERAVETPTVAVAAAGDVLPAVPTNPANPFSTRHALPASRPWPRAVVPGMPASGAFTVDYGGNGAQSPGFYPFEPARLQPQRVEPLPDAP
jgi:negative regulator of sigma E activity